MATDGEDVDIDALKTSGLAVEFLPNRLYFASFGCHPSSTKDTVYFTTDHHLQYTPYFADFGPLSISHFVHFSAILSDHMKRNAKATIVYYSSHNVHNRANAAALIACFCVAALKQTPAEVYSRMQKMYPPLLPFRDAAFGISSYNLTVFDCISGLAKAIDNGWFDQDTFNIEEYKFRDEVENGDWNAIVPKKIVAFSSPVEGVREVKTIVPPFRAYGVSAVVRLNDALYDRRELLRNGFDHYDIPFVDGGNPSDLEQRQFLEAAAKAHGNGGAIAVHCKAGLGRTGTMICIWMITNHGFTSREAIGWCRLCRPGSVIGTQQKFLDLIELRSVRAINQMKPKPFLAPVILYKKLQPPVVGISKLASKRRGTLDAADMKYMTQEAELSMFTSSFVNQDKATSKCKYESSKAMTASNVNDAVEKQVMQLAERSRVHAVRSQSTTPGLSNKGHRSSIANVRSASQMSTSLSRAMSVPLSLTIGSVDDVLASVVQGCSRPQSQCSVDPGWATATQKVVY